jgi:preprotein translocase subunit YajC
LSAHLFLFFSFFFSLSRERAEREKQYHSQTHTVVSFYLFWFVLIAVERSQNKLQ